MDSFSWTYGKERNVFSIDNKDCTDLSTRYTIFLNNIVKSRKSYVKLMKSLHGIEIRNGLEIKVSSEKWHVDTRVFEWRGRDSPSFSVEFMGKQRTIILYASEEDIVTPVVCIDDHYYQLYPPLNTQ